MDLCEYIIVDVIVDTGVEIMSGLFHSFKTGIFISEIILN